jgi:MazG family protein
MSAQSHETLKRYLIEETGELLEVLERPTSRERAKAHRDELGDVLLQVALQSLIAEEVCEERGEGFELREVFDTLTDKLVRRHPHVFAGARADTPDEVHALWQAVKTQERASTQEDTKERTQEGRAWRPPHKQTPPLSRAVALSDAAAAFGFDWPSAHGALDKVHEERLEVLDAMERELGAEAIESELGDLLYATVNACRQLNVDPARALQGTCERFQARIEGMLSLAQARGLVPSELSLNELEALWVEVKGALKR